MHSEDVRVVIACVTYNHEKFIATALESFLSQRLNEPFHVYVHDDCSTDKTSEIIRRYRSKYPHIIKATLHKKNNYSRGISVSRDCLFPSIKAQYVALCEGDDFFTNPYKLQKQVDFLDANLDHSICFHSVICVKNQNLDDAALFPPAHLLSKSSFELSDLLKFNFIQTNSCMYRWRFNQTNTPQELIPEGILPCDHFWHLLHAECGKVGYLKEAMSAYNIHDGGLWNSDNKTADWHVAHGLECLKFYDEVEKRYNSRSFLDAKHIAGKSYLYACIINDRKDLSAEFSKKYPEIYAEVVKENSIDETKILPSGFQK